MDFLAVYTFLNLTLGLLTVDFNSKGRFSPSPNCISKHCGSLPAECSRDQVVEITVKRNVFTADDHYCISLGLVSNQVIRMSTLFIGDYDLDGEFGCDQTALSFGIVSNNLGVIENPLKGCDNYGLRTGLHRFSNCYNSSTLGSKLTDKKYALQLETAAPINTRGVEVFNDFVGFTYYRTLCDSLCGYDVSYTDFEFGNYAFHYPLCNDHIPLCYEGDEDPCPKGYRLERIFVDHFFEGQRKLPRTICVSESDPGTTFPAWYKVDPSTYDRVVGNRTINIADKCDLAVRKNLKFYRYGTVGHLFSDIMVVTVSDQDYLSSNFCRSYVFNLGRHFSNVSSPSMWSFLKTYVHCDSDGCGFKGPDFQKILTLCEPHILVDKKAALVSSFSIFNVTYGGKVGFLPTSLTGSVLSGYNVYAYHGFLTFSLDSITLKTVSITLVKAESEWYMKLMMFFADDVLKVCFETIFSVLFNALSTCLGFIFKVGGCCFHLVFLCIMDSLVILLCLLPCYCHLGFILCSVANLIIKLFMRENCCVGIPEVISSTF
nr:P61 [Passion fruit green spot virus]